VACPVFIGAATLTRTYPAPAFAGYYRWNYLLLHDCWWRAVVHRLRGDCTDPRQRLFGGPPAV